MATILREKYDWEAHEIKKIWSFGLEDYEGNILTDSSFGIEYLKEVSSTISAGFMNVLRCGPLCEEKLRGVQFRVTDATLHPDPMHRGSG